MAKATRRLIRLDFRFQKHKFKLLSLLFTLTCAGCSSLNFKHTVNYVDIPKFMGPWYVWAGRTTYFEKGAHRSIEEYTWNKEKSQIDINFTYHKDSLTGPLKSMPQKAWIENTTTNAHWKVQPFWPLKFDYLVVDLDLDYKWTVIGVPSGSYVWIMGRTPLVSEAKLAEIIQRIQKLGYPVENIVRVPQE
jgi:apolipoprotein D and lipocalin family protein